MHKKILITGANGFVGNSLLKSFKREGFLVVGLDLSNKNGKDINICNVADSDSLIKELESFQPDIIIHCAAIKNLPECEENKELSFRCNVLSTEYIVQYAKQNRTKLIYISSDVVFDGKEGNYSTSSPVRPINWYGKTKCFSELLVQQLENFAICRTALIIGNLNKFYKQILNSELNNEVLINQTVLPQYIYNKLFNDKTVTLQDEIISNPTPIELLIKFIFQIIKEDRVGIFNTAGPNSVSRYEFGRIIATNFKLNSNLILKDSRKISPLRPKNISLETKQTFSILGINPEDWQLEDYLSNTKLYE